MGYLSWLSEVPNDKWNSLEQEEDCCMPEIWLEIGCSRLETQLFRAVSWLLVRSEPWAIWVGLLISYEGALSRWSCKWRSKDAFESGVSASRWLCQWIGKGAVESGVSASRCLSWWMNEWMTWLSITPRYFYLFAWELWYNLLHNCTHAGFIKPRWWFRGEIYFERYYQLPLSVTCTTQMAKLWQHIFPTTRNTTKWSLLFSIAFKDLILEFMKHGFSWAISIIRLSLQPLTKSSPWLVIYDTAFVARRYKRKWKLQIIKNLSKP